jgi:hypothetical protein
VRQSLTEAGRPYPVERDGFKLVAENGVELRGMMNALIALTLSSA